MKAAAEGTPTSEPAVEAKAREFVIGSAPRSVRVPNEAASLPHVLYVIDQLCQLGGAERVLVNITRRIAPDRFRCSLVTFKVDPDFDLLQRIGCPIHVLPLRCTYDWQALRMALELREFVRREKVSIVHSFFETSDLWAAPIAKWSGCPVMVSSRRDMGILRGRKHKLAYPIVDRLFDRVLAVSDEVRSYCLNHDRLRPEKVETLYNGIDVDELSANATEYDAREQFALPPTAPVISTLANVRAVKGLDVLVQAAALVCGEFPNAMFLIGGSVLEPELYSGLLSLVASLRLDKNVRFLGNVSNPAPLLRASDLFCLPSRSEGFSNALVEAMASGLACVATRVGGNAEALGEGTSGYLVASEDARALADRIVRLLRNPELRREMGRAARRSVEERFSMQAMMSRLMNVYDELLELKHV
jgi:glycosyltransferase involved in cell wall biosynthesis